MFNKTELDIKGVYLFSAPLFQDDRGSFFKFYAQSLYLREDLNDDFKEEYITFSKKGVFRGMHFQVPPSSHVKVVSCVAGKALDVLVDLRQGSPTYKKAVSIELCASKGQFVYIPEGVAHGFYSRSENTAMLYKVTSEYSPECDDGILWSSIDIKWPFEDAIVSDRDRGFSPIQEFVSPFEYDK